MSERRIVVFTTDIVGPRMAGPGMRALNLARELSQRFDVALVAAFDEPLDEAFACAPLASAAAARLLERADWLIGQPTRQLFALRRSRHKVAFDLFDPLVLELDQLYGSRPPLRQRLHQFMEWRRLRRALRTGDVLIAATPQQEQFYRGVATPRGRFVIVPFGADIAPAASQPKEEPPMILWSGGIWAWLDPLLAIEAVEEVNRRGVECRLVFFGGARPASGRHHAAFREAVKQAAARSEFVLWHDRWVPFAKRWEWLHRARVAIMLHRRTPEAEVSIRTRMFDAMAAGIPVVATDGGFAAELVRTRNLGVVVEPESRDSVVQAVIRLLSDDGFYRSSVQEMGKAAEEFRWQKVVEPLIGALGDDR